MPEVTLRLYGYLARIAGKREISLSFPLLPTVKHLAEHLGIPHTEIDLILINGEEKDFSAIPLHDNRVALYPRWHHLPVSHLQENPPQITFVVDVNLGQLAKLLRMLGFDTLYNNHYTDRELLEIVQKEKRILLTRDKALLYHQSVKWGHWVMTTNPYEQIAEVVDLYALYDHLSPLTRCLLCNEPLLSIDKKSIEHQLPPRVKEWCEEFYTCPLCHRLYWKGSHYDHMISWIEKLRK